MKKNGVLLLRSKVGGVHEADYINERFKRIPSFAINSETYAQRRMPEKNDKETISMQFGRTIICLVSPLFSGLLLLKQGNAKVMISVENG